MCGIIGNSGSFDPEQLRQGNRAQCHRGPDDSGEFFHANARMGLGFLRLSILDLSPLGHQPMTSENGEVVLVFNGEALRRRRSGW